ncbi:MAG TPA: 16S rRNA processing protein RimM [Clostridiaceae bacterium]|nr:16S rRNA processing protein RimM [Clostridiaceae bacterium]
MHQYLEIGKIINTHGVRGEVKVIPLTDNIERFDDLEWVFVDRSGNLERHNVLGVKYFRDLVILKLEGINNMNEAETLKGLFLLVDRENAVKLPEDTYFICDIIGCEVLEENGNTLGIVEDVLQTGSNDVYVVKGHNGREILIPALKSVVLEVLIEEKKIIVKIPEGLIDNEV